MTGTETLLTAAEGATLLGTPQALRRRPAPGKPVAWATADEREQSIAERFRRDSARHQMTVLHEDGLYRHLRFSSNPSGYSEYWFDIVTWPGSLAIRGDIDGYMFSRTRDMFEFFRADRRWGINAHYWAEKTEGGRRSVQVYSEDLFRQLVVEHFVDAARWGGVPAGLGKAVRTEILDRDLTHEAEARELLEGFSFKGFEFDDVWEWDFHDHDRSFLWACHAIAWGIARYDRMRRYGLLPLAAPKAVAA
ncbi:hypothetical protein [Streptomyces sp. NRRL S-1813]|uniref:hypothetical protein n=1 Tax=Streptomyces sp. NRRL S-1813 TaxID=1463888 RepID=UPI00068D4E85|nr:hypothetical protein [Streptomyces sp. NRRL S-1813]